MGPGSTQYCDWSDERLHHNITMEVEDGLSLVVALESAQVAQAKDARMVQRKSGKTSISSCLGVEDLVQQKLYVSLAKISSSHMKLI